MSNAMTETPTGVEKSSPRSKKSPLSGLGFDSSAPLLEVENLQVEFHTRDGIAHAVNGVSFTLDEGETLGDPRRVGLRQVRDRTGDHGDPRHPTRPGSPAARCSTAASTC